MVRKVRLPLLAIVAILIIAIGTIAYQHGLIERYERAERLAEARSMLPKDSSATCLRLLAYEDACVEPWGLVAARDDPQEMTFFWRGTVSTRIEIIVNDRVVQGLDTEGSEPDDVREIRGYLFMFDPEIEPGSYNATIIARPGNQSVTFPLFVVGSVYEALEPYGRD